jgi:hypothetical protein
MLSVVEGSLTARVLQERDSKLRVRIASLLAVYRKAEPLYLCEVYPPKQYNLSQLTTTPMLLYLVPVSG